LAGMLVALAMPSAAEASFPGANGKIAFTKEVDESAAIHTVNADGSGDADLGAGTNASWSADGTRIAFENAAGIWVMDADGLNRHRIVAPNLNSAALDPTWSPAGDKLAFVRESCFTDPQSFCLSVLATVNADGTGETTIESTRDRNPLAPSWSPDGTKIAFSGHFEAVDLSPGDIYTINPDGTGRAQLTNAPDDETLPDWSPDGGKILAADEQSLFTINADGSGRSSIPSTDISTGAWSPDGAKIALSKFTLPGASYELYTANIDGSGLTRLTSDPTAASYLPSWQPLVGPARENFKNASQFCKAQRDFLGDQAFAQRYGGGANAYARCVSGKGA
jgi:Tol biopolymer transport system component